MLQLLAHEAAAGGGRAARARTATAPVEIRITDADGVLLHRETLERPKKFDKEAR